MSIKEKICVGCGIVYAYLDIGDTLYCSIDCSENHSLLVEQVTKFNEKEYEPLTGQESFPL